ISGSRSLIAATRGRIFLISRSWWLPKILVISQLALSMEVSQAVRREEWTGGQPDTESTRSLAERFHRPGRYRRRSWLPQRPDAPAELLGQLVAPPPLGEGDVAARIEEPGGGVAFDAALAAPAVVEEDREVVAVLGHPPPRRVGVGVVVDGQDAHLRVGGVLF